MPALLNLITSLGKSRGLRGSRRQRIRNATTEVLEDRRLLSADGWTQRGGGAGHSGYVDVSFDPSHLEDLWQQDLGYTQSGNASWRERAVAIDDNHIYRTALEGYAPVGTYHVIAYNRTTGDEVWHRTFTGGAFEGVGEPTVANGVVYVNRAGHSGLSGGTSSDLPRIYGLDAATGNTVSQTTYAAQWGSNERLVIADDRVVVEDGYYGGVSSYTITPAGLSEQWTSRGSIYTSPFATLDDEYAYAYSNLIYRLSDGAQLGAVTHPVYSNVRDAMVSDTNELYFSVGGLVNGVSQTAVARYDGDTHQPIWTTVVPGAVGAKAVGNGIVAVASGSQLSFLDVAEGSILTSWQAPSNLLTGEIILTQTHAFVQTVSYYNATVHAVDIATGQKVWSFDYSLFGGASMEMAMDGDDLVLSHHQFVRVFSVAENQPPIAMDDTVLTDEDSSISIDVLNNDTDANPDVLTVSAVSLPANGTVVINADQSVTYTPTANFFGNDSFTYTISDGRGGVSAATVSVTVNPVNDAPEAIDAVFSLDENSEIGTVLGAIDASDIDGDALEFSIQNGSDAFTIDAQTGVLSVADSSLIDYESAAAMELIIAVTDGNGGLGVASVHVDINDIVLESAVDIVPFDSSNQINLRSKTVEVALFGTASFDPAAEINFATVRLRTADSETGSGIDYHSKKGYRISVRDVNGDGIADLVMTFKLADVGLQTDVSSLILEGSLNDGRLFSVEQSISVVGKGRRK